MKKVTTLVIAALMLVGVFNLQAQEDRILTSGFSLNLALGFPSDTYGLAAVSTEKFGTNFGLQIGSQWYIKPQEKWGVGIMVNWFDIMVAISKWGPNDVSSIALEVSSIELGPIGTYLIADNMGVDLYYNLRPTGLVSIVDGDENIGAGLAHAVGTRYRYKVFSMGLEYNIGKLAVSDISDTGFDINQQVNSFKMLLGFKF